MAFASGSVGVIYRQFTLSMAVAILFSAFLALTLTPALCATLLKPVDPAHHQKRGFFGGFNRRFEHMTRRYESQVGKLILRSGRVMLVFVALSAALVVGFRLLPSSFLPEEDQGYFMTMFQLPADATSERTLDIVQKFERHVASRPGIEANLSILGFGFSGSGSNAAMAFTTMKDWKNRVGATAQSEVSSAGEAMADAAVLGGMPRAQAYKFAAQAVMGSAKMVLESGEHPGALKDMVCSPGGTTIEAVRVLEEKGFRSAVIEAMVKCMEKSEKLSRS